MSASPASPALHPKIHSKLCVKCRCACPHGAMVILAWRLPISRGLLMLAAPNPPHPWRLTYPGIADRKSPALTSSHSLIMHRCCQRSTWTGMRTRCSGRAIRSRRRRTKGMATAPATAARTITTCGRRSGRARPSPRVRVLLVIGNVRPGLSAELLDPACRPMNIIEHRLLFMQPSAQVSNKLSL